MFSISLQLHRPNGVCTGDDTAYLQGFIDRDELPPNGHYVTSIPEAVLRDFYARHGIPFTWTDDTSDDGES